MRRNIATNCNVGDAGCVNRLHVLFYAATLVFLVLDYVFDINLRAAFLEPYEAARGFYYLFLFVCLALILRFPDKAVFVGTLESAITIAALIVSFWVRFLIPTDAMMESGRGIVTFQEVANFLISGLYGYFAYVSGIRQLNRTKNQ